MKKFTASAIAALLFAGRQYRLLMQCMIISLRVLRCLITTLHIGPRL